MSLARATKIKADPSLNEDVILLQKGLVWFPPSEEAKDNLCLASTVQSNLMQFRYSLDKDAFKALRYSSDDTIIKFNERITEYLDKVMGIKDAVTMYPGFPKQVMDMDEAQLLENAIMHEFSNGQFMPGGSVTHVGGRAYESVKYITLTATNSEGLLKIFTDLVSINQSLTPEDLRVVTWFVKSGLPLKFPNQIPFKENLCTLASLGVPGLPIKTPTDVLRIAVHLSGGDISLPKVPSAMKSVNRGWGAYGKTLSRNAERDSFKFKKFKRSERRYLLELLENSNCMAEDMVGRRSRWIALGEVLHPGDYSSQYPKAFKAFTALRQKTAQSWYSRVKEAFKDGYTTGLKVLTERPGEFMRVLDWLLRKYPANSGYTCSTLAEIGAKSSNKVLFESFAHFMKRDQAVTGRKITIKGARKPTMLPDLPALKSSVVQTVLDSIKLALKSKFALLEKLGKVYIDPELDKIPLPTNMRSLNFSLRPVIRGQRTPWDNPNAIVIRSYFHWTDDLGVLDPDLSGSFVNEKNRSTYISYSQMKDTMACHSGDIIARRGKNAEYIDVDVQKALDAGWRYVCFDVRNFRGGSLASMQGIFGIMERDYPESDKHWLPETVSNAFSCESTASNTLMGILDLKTKEYIHLDVDSAGNTTAAGDQKNIIEKIKMYSEPPAFSVGDLLRLHAEARGEIVSTPEEADIQFQYKDFCNSYEKTGAYMGV